MISMRRSPGPLGRQYTFPGLRTSTQPTDRSAWIEKRVRSAATCESMVGASSSEAPDPTAGTRGSPTSRRLAGEMM